MRSKKEEHSGIREEQISRKHLLLFFLLFDPPWPSRDRGLGQDTLMLRERFIPVS